MDNRRIVKSAFGMGIVTFVSRVFGLVREWLRGYLLGTSGSSDAFALAFMFPNLLRRLVGEGAMTAAFVPVLSDYKEKNNKDDLDDFVNSFFSMLFFFLIFIVVLMVALAPVLKYLLPQRLRAPYEAVGFFGIVLIALLIGVSYFRNFLLLALVLCIRLLGLDPEFLLVDVVSRFHG